MCPSQKNKQLMIFSRSDQRSTAPSISLQVTQYVPETV